MPAPKNSQWQLAARPVGNPKVSDFNWVETDLAPLQDGQLLVRNLWLSLDPTNRVWMNDADSYLPKLNLGEVMRGSTLGIVEESRNPKFQPGDQVAGLLGWQKLAISDGRGLSKLPALPIPLEAHFGLLSHIGFTAYFGMLDIGQPKAGETVVVTAAAGAVGSLAAQIGKIQGCRVVGIAGTDEKCRWLTDDLGIDAAINYKTEKVSAALDRHCPKGIDIDFENVGGPIFEAILSRINLRARIALCGMIAGYNATRPEPGPSNLFMLIGKRARIEGFLVLDYLNRFAEATAKLVEWHLAGKLKYKLDVVEGLENAPQALNRLFTGANTGKLLVKLPR